MKPGHSDTSSVHAAGTAMGHARVDADCTASRREVTSSEIGSSTGDALASISEVCKIGASILLLGTTERDQGEAV